MPEVFDPSLELVIEGWGGKQGWHYPTWKVRWFVLQKKPSPPDSDEVTDARDYFKNSSDRFERAHNFNVKSDKKYLVLSYFTDETKTELKEVFHFDENTSWGRDTPRITTPKHSQARLEALNLYCKGSNGSAKLVFIPFWGFADPNWKLRSVPWQLSFEFGYAKCYKSDEGGLEDFYEKFITVDEDKFGWTSKDLEKKHAEFCAIFEDDLVFKEYKESVMASLKLFVPIKFFGANAQEDNKAEDEAKANIERDSQTDWQMRFNKKMKELNAQKESVGSRALWLKYLAQARNRSVTFETWMKIRKDDGNEATVPVHLR